LFSAQGITGYYVGYPLRSAPSAGALYPFEIYVIVNNVSGLKRGIYHYQVLTHSLELIKLGDYRSKITNCCLNQDMAGKSGVTFVLTAIFERVTFKYDERGYRYVYIEAGHISQNIYLQATSLGLGSVVIGAFYDDKINKLLKIDGKKEAAIYVHAVGKI
jgi:SagB-type dehydrogenase family enzyme